MQCLFEDVVECWKKILWKLGEKKEKIDLEEKKNVLERKKNWFTRKKKNDLKERFIKTVSNEDHLCPQIERY